MRCVGRGKKTWGVYKCFDMIMLGVEPEWAIFRDVWKDCMGQNNSLGWNRL